MHSKKLLLFFSFGLHLKLFQYAGLLVQGENVNAIFRKIECTDSDPELLADNITCRVKAISRNLYHLNMHFWVIKPADNLIVRIKVFKKNNTFQPFLIDIEENFCDFLSKKHVSVYMRIIGDMYFPYSNVNKSCPLMGEQIFKDMPLKLNKIPSVWPAGEYRLDSRFFRNHKSVLTIRFGFYVPASLGEGIGRR
ncbi:uncharacterized protein LOC129907825 [Episyrphus balteatus]|uniref:uncharacterized protein LOC129907825 n=1 Tax=Episyrphus balteatus TaxID=286459 RepID=UPI0024853961|nr:uncharacterized protein LOC129907825 [Episyrphus balteatus]